MTLLTENQQQYINSLPDKKKYYKCKHYLQDIRTQEEYDKMPSGKEKYYYEIDKPEYINTFKQMIKKEMPPCPITSSLEDFWACGDWIIKNNIPSSLAAKLV